MILPFSSTAPMRSASPSKAMPSSAPFACTAPTRSSRFFGHRRVRVVVGEAPVHLAEQLDGVHVQLRKIWCIAGPAVPLPASMTDLDRAARQLNCDAT